MVKLLTRQLPSLMVILFLSVFAISGAHAQERVISGTITDANDGSPLIGVTIVVVGQKNVGTTTDFNGEYTLQLLTEAKQIHVSYIGYSSQVIDITSDRIDVALKEESEVLNEVVVVGYGTLKTKQITSAVAVLKEEDFNQGNISDPAQLLQGKVSGLSIAKPGGDPNAGFDIRLRGLSTFGANTSPLIIVDGVPGVSMETLDPQDIASINVLKDASAAAIYGTRGASGVILITTKTGSKETTTAEYSAFVALNQVARKPDVLTASEYKSLSRAVDLGSETDWIDAITRNAISHTHNLSLSGGNSKSNYRIALNYRKGQGIALKSGFDQINGRVNFNQKAFNDKLNIGINIANTIRNEQLAIDPAFGFAIRYNPTAPTHSDEEDLQDWGGYFQRDAFGFFNPLAAMEQNVRDKKKKRFLASIKGDLELMPGLNAGVLYARTNENDIYGEYYSKRSYWTPFGVKNDKGFAGKYTDERYDNLFESTLNYEHDFSGLELKLLGGYSFQEFTKEGHGASAGGFLTDGFGYNNIGAATDIKDGKASISSYKSRHRIIAFFGRTNFNYKDIYFLSASIRREGSSKFGKNNKWGWFPGISGGLNLSKLVDIPMVDQLKIRGGYGVTGNTPSDPYLSILKFNPQGGLFFYQGAYVDAYGPANNPNPDLRWERKEDINIGMDMSLLDYKMNVTVDYFRSKSSDLLLYFPVRVPPNLYPDKLLNLAEMSTSGIEFSVGIKDVTKGAFVWNPTLTFTKFNPSILDKFTSDEVESEGFRELGDLGAPFLTGVKTIRVEEGQPIGQIYGPVYDGLDEDGNIQIKDLNNDGVRDKEDVQVIGNALPDFQFGFSNSFRYKNFDFNFFIRGVFGHDLLNVSNTRYGVPNAIGIQNGMAQILDFAEVQNGPVFSDIHVEDASYVKLDNVSLGYNLKIKDKSLRLYITGQNLMTITGYSGIDPEVRYQDGGNPLAPGLDRENTYFATKGYTFGLNFKF